MSRVNNIVGQKTRWRSHLAENGVKKAECDLLINNPGGESGQSRGYIRGGDGERAFRRKSNSATEMKTGISTLPSPSRPTLRTLNQLTVNLP